MTSIDPRLFLDKFGLHSAEFQPLPSEMDQLYKVRDGQHDTYTLRISHRGTPASRIMFENALLDHLQTQDLPFAIPSLLEYGRNEDAQDTPVHARLMSWVPGIKLVDYYPKDGAMLELLGEALGTLTLGLQHFSHEAAGEPHIWKIDNLPWIKEQMRVMPAKHQSLVARSLAEIDHNLVPHLSDLPDSVCYHDANDHNILVQVGETPGFGFIDFGDACQTKTCLEIAIACTYLMMDCDDPINRALALLRGYHRKYELSDGEIRALPGLIKLRLLLSLTHSSIRQSSDPANAYNQVSNAPAWSLLTQLDEVGYSWMHYCFRYACGLSPLPGKQRPDLQQLSFAPMFPSRLKLTDLPIIDLSVESANLGTQNEINNPDTLDAKICAQLDQGWGLGRYDEPRSVYTTSAYLEPAEDGRAWRTHHLGIDVFAPAGTSIAAPAESRVFAVQDNQGDRNYGPTIIVEIESEPGFLLLLGHLSRSSLARVQVGDRLKVGEEFCAVGSVEENGGWTPHLHLQVVIDPLHFSGDFPGAAAPTFLPVWKALSPNPAVILGLHPASTECGRHAISSILDQRKLLLPSNLSISYDRPLHMVRGDGAYLLDSSAQRYLDMVNNVAHVGHEHQRVVDVARRQVATLNTNTRYLHQGILDFTEYLLSKCPSKYETVFLCNSGSEANELAMRIARTVTGREKMLALEVGYHGNTGACVEISSYKFDGPGGSGKSRRVEVLPMPDCYRGVYAEDHDSTLYEHHLQDALDRLGETPAAFIHESILSCGGQVEPPSGYFKTLYDKLKPQGVICIADEVQTGLGRVGERYWAFELFDIRPDLITVGKPLGNGHPLAAVITTRAIADAFANGMEYFNTFGGNPVSSMIGLEVLKVVDDEGLQHHALEMGRLLKDQLWQFANDFPFIGDVRGRGLFLGVEMSAAKKLPSAQMADYVVRQMRNRGILLSTDGPDHNVIKIKPPLVFSEANAQYFIDQIGEVFQHNVLRHYSMH